MSRIHAFCKVAVAPLRAEQRDASEQVSQLLFGELVEILENANNWTKIQSLHDGYEGWVDSKQLETLREKEVSRWFDGLGIEHSFKRTLKGPEGKLTIWKGSFIPDEVVTEFNIGKSEYRFLDEPETEPQSKIEFALSFLNIPYLWGGKSIAGIDCSGLMQVVHRWAGINFPRDAYQQEELGTTIDFEDREAGDLAFFISDSGKIHHVGLLVSKNEIIHAHGYVRIDDISELGITRKIDGVLSHKLYSVKRV